MAGSGGGGSGKLSTDVSRQQTGGGGGRIETFLLKSGRLLLPFVRNSDKLFLTNDFVKRVESVLLICGESAMFSLMSLKVNLLCLFLRSSIILEASNDCVLSCTSL